ncbi:MAG: hypothetical protein JST93_19995 [Acidobacteria bacterium]|nr:hypothetical protein [Acidobacteriota bacterium]
MRAGENFVDPINAAILVSKGDADAQLLRSAVRGIISEMDGETTLAWRLAGIIEALRPFVDVIDPSEANRMAHRMVAGILADDLDRGGAGVAALAGRLTRGDAVKLAHAIMDAMDKTSNWNSLGALGIALKGAAKQVGENPELLSAALKRAKGLARPPCEAVGLLASRNQLPVLVDLLKWG